MAKIKATRSVLYQNRLYSPGEELPQHDPAIVTAWLTAGSARPVDAPKSAPGKSKSAAKPSAKRAAT